MFWSASTLRERLPQLIDLYDAANIQRANYTLSVGPEIYVSPSRKPDGPTDQTKIQLGPDQTFRIPAGQFAFLPTEESIRVPANAIAFISIRARFKFRGLVNVSGFHVDPGFEGRLVFAVFNAGPSDITLARGEKCFHIWYADVDQPHEEATRRGYARIDSTIINDLGPQLHSFESLSTQIQDSEKRYHQRAEAIERTQDQLRTIGTVLITLFVALLVALLAALIPRWLPAPDTIQEAENISRQPVMDTAKEIDMTGKDPADATPQDRPVPQ